MKKYLLFLVLISPIYLFSQKKIVVDYHNDIETRIISDSRCTITFVGDDIVFNVGNDSVFTSSLSSVRKLYFEDDSNSIYTESENGSRQFEVYPNPATDFIKLRFLNNNKYRIDIFDVNGRLVKSLDLYEKDTLISISDLENGLYFIKTSSNTQSFKFIKQ